MDPREFVSIHHPDLPNTRENPGRVTRAAVESAWGPLGWEVLAPEDDPLYQPVPMDVRQERENERQELSRLSKEDLVARTEGLPGFDSSLSKSALVDLIAPAIP